MSEKEVEAVAERCLSQLKAMNGLLAELGKAFGRYEETIPAAESVEAQVAALVGGLAAAGDLAAGQGVLLGLAAPRPSPGRPAAAALDVAALGKEGKAGRQELAARAKKAEVGLRRATKKRQGVDEAERAARAAATALAEFRAARLAQLLRLERAQAAAVLASWVVHFEHLQELNAAFAAAAGSAMPVLAELLANRDRLPDALDQTLRSQHRTFLSVAEDGVPGPPPLGAPPLGGPPPLAGPPPLSQQGRSGQPAPASGKAVYAVALYDYVSDEAEDLEFKAGDRLLITSPDENGWTEGTLDGHTGIFPTTYIEYE